MQATQALPPQAVQVQMTAPVPSPQRSRYSCGAKTLGILQIVLCGISVALGVTVILLGPYLNIFGGPIWGALFFYLPAGILGILSVAVPRNSRRCVAVASLVMCILAAVMAFGNTGISIASAAIGNHAYLYNNRVSVPLDAVLTVVAFVELVAAILASVFSGMVMREYADVTPPVQYMTQGYPHAAFTNPNAAPYNMYPTGNAPMYPTGNAPMYTTGNAPMAQPQPVPVYSAGSSGGPPDTADYGEKTGNLP